MTLYNKFDKKFANQFKNYVKQKVDDFAVDLGEDIAKAFVNQAKKRLLSGATPRGPEDAEIVQKIADSIHYVKKGKKFTVVIPRDAEGLNVFLEYGTGLAGKNAEQKNPDAKRVGWQYAIHEADYKYRMGSPKGLVKTKGFLFKKKGTYLDREDLNPLISVKETQPYSDGSYAKEITVSGYTDKRGRVIPSYTKVISRTPHTSIRAQYDWVLSQGLKPVRYVYSTRVNLNRVIGQFRNKPKGYIGLRRKLKELQK